MGIWSMPDRVPDPGVGDGPVITRGVSTRYQYPEGEYTLVCEPAKYLESVRMFYHVELWHFEVYPSFRGEGAAKTLLARAIENAKTIESSKYLRLFVKATNIKAVNLFFNAGFKIQKYLEHAEEYDMWRKL